MTTGLVPAGTPVHPAPVPDRRVAGALRAAMWPGSWAALLVVPASLGFGAYTAVTGTDFWPNAWMTAADRGGLYLFFASPIAAGIACWETYSWRASLGDLGDGMALGGALWRSAWIRVAALALACHVLVLSGLLVEAWRRGATGSIQWSAVAVQFLSVAGFGALGAIVGSRARSYLAAPGLLAVLVLLNTVLAQFGFRRFSQVGEGLTDFVDLRYTSSLLVLKALFFLGLIAAAIPLRLHRRGGQLRAAAALVVVGACAVMIWTSTAPLLSIRAEATTCAGTRPQICLPASLETFRPQITAATETVRAQLLTVGITAIPTTAAVVPRLTTSTPRGTIALYLSPSTVRNRALLLREVVRGFTEAQGCDDLAGRGPADSVIVGRATLDGWLQNRVGAVEPGSYPTDLVAGLDRLAPEQRDTLLDRLYRQVWSCAASVTASPGDTR